MSKVVTKKICCFIDGSEQKGEVLKVSALKISLRQGDIIEISGVKKIVRNPYRGSSNYFCITGNYLKNSTQIYIYPPIRTALEHENLQDVFSFHDSYPKHNAMIKKVYFK